MIVIRVVAIKKKKIFCKSFFITQLLQKLKMLLQYLQGFDLIKFLSVHTVDDWCMCLFPNRFTPLTDSPALSFPYSSRVSPSQFLIICTLNI